MKKKTIVGLSAAAGIIGATVIKAAKFKPETPAWEPLPEEKTETERYIQNLSDAIKIPTISNRDDSVVDWTQFDKFHALLEERYPLVHQKLKKEIVSKASLLYFWEGSDSSLKPIALLAHQDVVPVSAGTEDDWVYPAFSGTVADGFIWGRGALDIKNHLIAVLDSVETLLAEGFEPKRSIYLCFGHNEEVMADDDTNGAKTIVKLLKSRGVELECLIDEGGAILPVNIKGIINKRLAGIGIAEKGHCDFRISVSGKGGHSSQPPKHTALGALADVIKDLENNQFKAELTPMISMLFDKIGRNTSFPARLVACNLNILKPVVLEIMKQIPPAACMARTTTAITMASGSPAPNVLPQKASIIVNLRIMPGMTIEDVEKHLRKVIKNKDVEIELIKGENPSSISPTDSDSFKTIEDICYRMNKDNIVAPYLVMGGTDARNYEPICENVYRYSPFTVSTELLLTTHGTNERLPLDSVEEALVFFKHFIKAMCK